MVWELSRVPLVVAPMAGGATTPALASAATEAGAFAFLAAGYLTPEVMAEQIRTLRERTRHFGVNVFVVRDATLDPRVYAQYASRLRQEAEPYGLLLPPEPITDDDHYQAKLDLLLHDPVPVVSFTFGLPPDGDIAALRRAGSTTLATVTSVQEARAAEDAGVDGLVVQAAAAGGHSATHDAGRLPETVRPADLVRRIRGATDHPLLAAGGVDGPDAVKRLVQAGADAVMAGTLFLLAPEAGTSPTHRAALQDPRFTRTSVTRAFTGRPARGLHNGFMERHDAAAPVGYPAVHHLTRPLRAAAAAAGDADRVHLWAGTGFKAARQEPAGETVRRLTRDL